jgi:hypothetical protein
VGFAGESVQCGELHARVEEKIKKIRKKKIDVSMRAFHSTARVEEGERGAGGDSEGGADGGESLPSEQAFSGLKV